MLLKEMIAVYSAKYTELTCTLFLYSNVELLNGKVGGTYIYRRFLHS